MDKYTKKAVLSDINNVLFNVIELKSVARIRYAEISTLVTNPEFSEDDAYDWLNNTMENYHTAYEEGLDHE